MHHHCRPRHGCGEHCGCGGIIAAVTIASIKPPRIVMSSNLDKNLENIRRIRRRCGSESGYGCCISSNATIIAAGNASGICYGDCSAILAKNGKCTTTVGRDMAAANIAAVAASSLRTFVVFGAVAAAKAAMAVVVGNAIFGAAADGTGTSHLLNPAQIR
ncbi:hypothetical protein niasHT_008216 [Heterodera trifolii]|uniref:Uncharacterized protein n=1 Tax=Heterodera trifolii TaxID=157864 RepID=A0ABD2LX76_9BILA